MGHHVSTERLRRSDPARYFRWYTTHAYARPCQRKTTKNFLAISLRNWTVPARHPTHGEQPSNPGKSRVCVLPPYMAFQIYDLALLHVTISG